METSSTTKSGRWIGTGNIEKARAVPAESCNGGLTKWPKLVTIDLKVQQHLRSQDIRPSEAIVRDIQILLKSFLLYFAAFLCVAKPVNANE